VSKVAIGMGVAHRDTAVAMQARYDFTFQRHEGVGRLTIQVADPLQRSWPRGVLVEKVQRVRETGNRPTTT
jgi:hypothetical protein